MSHVQRLITKHFSQGLEPQEQQKLRAHLRLCAECRERYDRQADLLRAAAGRVPTRSEEQAWEKAVVQQLFEAPLREVPAKKFRLGRIHWAPVAATAVLLLTSVSLLQLRPTQTPPTPRLKGAAGQGPTLAALEIFAITAGQGGTQTPRKVEDNQAVGLDEFVQFRYRTNDPHHHHLYLFGLDQRMKPLDYFPRPSTETSLPIEPGLKPIAVPRSIRLARRHQTGALWVYGLFSRRALSREQVHGQVASLVRRGQRRPPEMLSFGPEIHAVVRRIRLQGGDPTGNRAQDTGNTAQGAGNTAQGADNTAQERKPDRGPQPTPEDRP